MDKLMLQFHFSGAAPTLEEAMGLFGLAAGEADAEFGVVVTDPANRLCTILVAATAESKVQKVLAARPKRDGEGIFSSPRIEPFGPP